MREADTEGRRSTGRLCTDREGKLQLYIGRKTEQGRRSDEVVWLRGKGEVIRLWRNMN